MAPRVFITGVTGYIAGDAFVTLYDKHPDYDYALLVRTQEKADKVKKAYPKTSIVLGSLDDSELLEQEAAKADIVLHAADASDHEGAAKAIAAGLVKGHSKDNPGFWLHLGGTGILTFWDSRDDFKGLGTWSDREYDDLDRVAELTTLPDDAFHRNVDKIVLAAGEEHGDAVKTCIVSPPTIYGKGRGPISGRGRQVYELAKLVLDKGYIPIVGEGKSRWNHVHIEDLSEVLLLLAEKAAAKDINPELWGAKGYILVENGEHIWGDLARQVGSEAAKLGYISDPKEDSLGKDKALEQAGFEAISWGLNSRGRARRARQHLGWSPTKPSLEEEVPNILKDEKQRASG